MQNIDGRQYLEAHYTVLSTFVIVWNFTSVSKEKDVLTETKYSPFVKYQVNN